MEALNDTIVDLGGSPSKESKLFDFPCFREAWLNACQRNRWSRQTPPAVYMFEDRIEVISVGGLPEELTLEEFYEGKSKPVNLELQQIMVQLDYIEQTEHGVPLIVSKYGKEVFDITENFITVTIPLNKGKVVERDLQKMKRIVLNECDKKILSRMKENSNITVHEISGQIGVGVTTVTKHIRVLREKGIIKRIGSKKNGQWVIEEETL